MPECAAGPFPTVSRAGIGSLFHDICASLLAALESNKVLWSRQRKSLSNLRNIADKHGAEKATQPMRDFVYDNMLAEQRFARFHDLKPQEMLALWTAVDTFMVELAEVFLAADNKGLGLESALLGNEKLLTWLMEIDGHPLMVTGRYDLLLYDHRYSSPHLIDFKLCGVRKDLASLIQVMLYATMLHQEHGICSGATVLNLYPRRSPITVGWEQIKAFRRPLVEFIRFVASREFPAVIARPPTAQDLTALLSVPTTPFETPELLDSGLQYVEEIKRKLKEFGLDVDAYQGDGGSVMVGPAFMILRIVPGAGVKVAALGNRAKDLQVALALEIAPRIEQGPGYVGIEVPGTKTDMVRLLDLKPEETAPGASSFIFGVDITGTVRWGDFSSPSMCHMLVGGQTGSGKSEFVRQLLCSLALASTPGQLKMVIVDPKMTDYQDWNGSPYLECPVVDQMDEAVRMLAALVETMENRYAVFKDIGVKDLASYNDVSRDNQLPRLVVAFDEFADAMADRDLRKNLEMSLKRLGAKARAAGIHLIVATQSPRREVVTGLIKANLPCAVALRVANVVESRIIIDSGGAESLPGRGDLLAKIGGRIDRLQSPFVDAATIQEIMFPV